jgi:hypothetical protein
LAQSSLSPKSDPKVGCGIGWEEAIRLDCV